tara:strand:- start:4539 stop:5600 length:1062 start_codon:yes stop_codon:yes gene_type:complete
MKEDFTDLTEKLSSFTPLGQSLEGGGDTDAWAKELVLSVSKDCEALKGATAELIKVKWISHEHLKDLFLCKFQYDDVKYVIKVFDNSKVVDKESLVLEAAKGKIKSEKFPTEELVFSSDKCIIIFAEEGCVANKFQASEIDYFSGQFGHSLSLVHSIKVKKSEFGTFRDLFLTVDHQRFKQVTKAIFDSIDSKLSSDKVLCHGDVKAKNLIIGPKGGEPQDMLVKFLNFDLAVVDRPEIECVILLQELQGVNEKVFFNWYCQGDKKKAAALGAKCQSIKFECLAMMFIAKWHEVLTSLSAESEGVGAYAAIDSFLNIGTRIREEFPKEEKKIKLDFFLKDLIKKIKIDDTTNI